MDQTSINREFVKRHFEAVNLRDVRTVVWEYASGSGGPHEMTNDFSVAPGPHEDPAEFRARFSRCDRLLYFIACRVLGGPEQADDAIENCRRTASRHPRRFEHEGAFRSWLLRVLIDEALAILRENQQTSHPKVSRQPAPSEAFREDAGSDAESSLPRDHYNSRAPTFFSRPGFAANDGCGAKDGKAPTIHKD